MSKQPPPAPTASTVGPCPTLLQISRTPWHWKLTQHHRTTRPPPVLFERVIGLAGRWHCVTFSTGASLWWSCGAMVLGKLPVPGLLTSLENSRARAYCACSRSVWRLFEHFFLSSVSSLLSPSLWEMARYRLKFCPTHRGVLLILDKSSVRTGCACSRCSSVPSSPFLFSFFSERRFNTE